MIFILIMHALLAATFAIGQAAVATTQPVFFIAIRMLFGGALLLGYLYFFRKKDAKLPQVSIFFWIQLILFHIYVPYITEFWALQYIGSAKAALIYSLSPFITALFEYYLFSVMLTKRKMTGLAIGFFGFLPLLLSCTPKECTATYFLYFSVPELALILSTISACYGWILIKRAVVQQNKSPILVNGIAMFGAGMLALVTSIFVDVWKPLPTTNPLNMFVFAAALILLSNVIFYNFYSWLMRRYSATFLSFSGFVIPLFAAFYQWLFFRESVSWHFFITATMVFVGLYIFYNDELKKD